MRDSVEVQEKDILKRQKSAKDWFQRRLLADELVSVRRQKENLETLSRPLKPGQNPENLLDLV